MPSRRTSPRSALAVLRTPLLCLFIVALAACADAPGDGDATATDGEPISIGFVGELTGPFAVWGIPARNGMQLAVEDVNADGGVDGRPLELLDRDTGGVPEEGVRALEGLVERSDVVAAGGIISSDVGLATSRAAEDLGVPLFLVKAGSDAILDAESRFTFRTCLPAAPVNLEPLVQFIDEQELTRVGAIIADYAWGRAIEEAIDERLGDRDDLELRVEVAPVPETDFTGHLRQLGDLDPEIIIATGHPPGAPTITRQAAELGMDAYVTGSDSSAATVMETVGDAAYDRYVDLSCADYAAADYRELATRYHTRFDAFMEDDAVAGYGQVLMVAEAIRDTGSTRPGDIAEHLHANSFELPGHAWEMEWTQWGEFVAARPLLVVMRDDDPPEGVNPGAAWYPEVILRSDPLEPFVP